MHRTKRLKRKSGVSWEVKSVPGHLNLLHIKKKCNSCFPRVQLLSHKCSSDANLKLNNTFQKHQRRLGHTSTFTLTFCSSNVIGTQSCASTTCVRWNIGHLSKQLTNDSVGSHGASGLRSAFWAKGCRLDPDDQRLFTAAHVKRQSLPVWPRTFK